MPTGAKGGVVIPFGTKSFILITLGLLWRKKLFEPVLYIYFVLFPNGSYLETADWSETVHCTIWYMIILILNIYYFNIDREMVSLQWGGFKYIFWQNGGVEKYIWSIV